MNFSWLSRQVSLSEAQVKAVVQLLDEGATLAFIARYRKEKTGGLDEVQIAAIREAYVRLTEVEKRREAILKSIDEQGKLTDELKRKIESVFTLTELEDLYLPYKQKRKTRASVALEKGLEPLAKTIFAGTEITPLKAAEKFLNENVSTVEDALQGARDIIAEWVNEDNQARTTLRRIFQRESVITSKVKRNKEEEGAKYRDYFNFSQVLNQIPSHRLLAIRRGEEEGILSVDISPAEETALEALERQFVKGAPQSKIELQKAVTDSYKRLLKPAIETEFNNLSKEKADKDAIAIFSENLRQLLLTSPLGEKVILAIDPGFRTGCKVTVIDKQASLVNDFVIYPFDKPDVAAASVRSAINRYGIEAIAIGNGTAGRETEDFIRGVLQKEGAQDLIEIHMVSEQGASIYSASDVAREEFPDKDVTVRGSVSIGRRLMDPLAELVKIDPKSIGVGQYQHDVNQSLLKKELDFVVESCVNQVGVSLNTASKHLLRYVSGLGPSLAQNIVDYRTKNGQFKSRRELLKVPRLGEKAYEQAAGFLRIQNATNPLDNSAVHPESYGVVERMAKDLNTTVANLIANDTIRKQIKLEKYVSEEIGIPTLQDILNELEKPSRDPRGQMQAFKFSDTIRKPDDLKVGMELEGIVTNITAFGAFVDIGVKQDGLVHVSQLTNRFIKDPNEVVKLRQIVRVKVLENDLTRKRIALTMKL